MKRFPSFGALIALFVVIIMSTSCKKEYVTNNYYTNVRITDTVIIDSVKTSPVANIIHTDTPPEWLFNEGSAYANNNQVWVTRIDVDSAKFVANTCMYNSYSDSYYDCGVWRRISAYKYWGVGLVDGITIVYLSAGKDWFAIGPEAFTQALKVTRFEKKIGIGWFDDGGYRSNPIGYDKAMGWIN